MRPEVAVEGGLRQEPAAALGAGVGPLPGVGALVPQQVRVAGKALPALRADEPRHRRLLGPRLVVQQEAPELVQLPPRKDAVTALDRHGVGRICRRVAAAPRRFPLLRAVAARGSGCSRG